MAVAQEVTRCPGRPVSAFWTIARRDSLAGFLFIAPQLIGIVIFVLIALGLVF
ncbi:hypothetical protein D3C78_1453890 [compost metagenome]